MSIRVGNKVIVGGAAIASVDEPGVMRPDGQTIDINEDIISVLAIKDQNKQDLSNIKFWTGTLQEYNNLGQWDDNTLYNITDDAPTSQEGIPLASQHNYGIVKVDGETIYSNNGVLTAHTTEEYTLPVASTNTLGGVKVDADTINITQEGVISANIITSYNDLTDKPTIPNAYTLPTASTSTLGGVKVDGDTIKITNGVISAKSSAGGDTWSYNKAGNGYIKHSSGILIQWGTLNIVADNNGTTLTFPTPFSSTNYSISASSQSSQQTVSGYTMWSGCCAISTKTKSTSSCLLVASSTGDEIGSHSTSATAFWIAVGY